MTQHYRRLTKVLRDLTRRLGPVITSRVPPMPTATLIRCATWHCGSTSYPTSVVAAVALPSDAGSSSNHQVNNSIITKTQGPKKRPVIRKSQPDVKASIRTSKKKCSQKGCSNVVVRGGVCVTHGAMVKRCSFDGCANGVFKGGVCWTHGANLIKKRCSQKGCINGARGDP